MKETVKQLLKSGAPPLVKIKQMYEVEQSTYAKLKQPKRGLREKNIS